MQNSLCYIYVQTEFKIFCFAEPRRNDGITKGQLPLLTSTRETPPHENFSSTTSDTAMKALSATYQTLNLTALALNQNRETRSFTLTAVSEPVPIEENRPRSATVPDCPSSGSKSSVTEVTLNIVDAADLSEPIKSAEIVKPSLSVVEKFNEENLEKSDSGSFELNYLLILCYSIDMTKKHLEKKLENVIVISRRLHNI